MNSHHNLLRNLHETGERLGIDGPVPDECHGDEAEANAVRVWTVLLSHYWTVTRASVTGLVPYLDKLEDKPTLRADLILFWGRQQRSAKPSYEPVTLGDQRVQNAGGSDLTVSVVTSPKGLGLFIGGEDASAHLTALALTPLEAKSIGQMLVDAAKKAAAKGAPDNHNGD